MNLRDFNNGDVGFKNWLNPVVNFLQAKDAFIKNDLTVEGNIINNQLGKKIYALLVDSTNINQSIERSIFDNTSGVARILANSLKVGDSFDIVASGKIGNIAGESLLFNLYLGETGTTFVSNILAIFPMSIATNKSYSLKVRFTVRSLGENGTYSLNGEFQNSIDGTAVPTSSTKSQILTNFDTTIDNVINITSQFGTQNPGNQLITEYLVVDKK